MAKGKKTGGRKKGTLNKINQSGLDFHIREYAKVPMVYLLKANNRYKIGRTTNMELRFKRCIGLCPYPIDLIWYLPTKDYFEIEKGLHKIFFNKRVHYEWFELTDDDVKCIMNITCKGDLVNVGDIFNFC